MTNGNAVHSTIIGNGSNALPTSTGWSSSNQDANGNAGGPGFNFIMVDNPGYVGFVAAQSTTGADDFFDAPYSSGTGPGGSRFALWGPDYIPGGGFPPTAGQNGLTNSPVGGSFLAADGAFFNRPVEQTLTGLEIGKEYALSFWWAAAQQGGLGGATKEAWIVCIGTCEYNTPAAAEGLTFYEADPGNTDIGDLRPNDLVYNPSDPSLIFKTGVVANPEAGFVPWQYEYFTFTATSTTTTLSLLAYGTPLGQPPFSLIDGITISSDGVPEPSTWGMMLIGFGIIGGVMRKRHPVSERRARKSQIV